MAVFPIPYSTDLMGSAPVQEHRCIGWAMAVVAVSPILEVGVGGNVVGCVPHGNLVRFEKVTLRIPILDVGEDGTVVEYVPHGNRLGIVKEAVRNPMVDHGIDRRVDDVPHGESRGVVKEVVHVAIVGRGNDHRVDEVPHGRSHGVRLPGVVLISQVREGHRDGPGVIQVDHSSHVSQVDLLHHVEQNQPCLDPLGERAVQNGLAILREQQGFGFDWLLVKEKLVGLCCPLVHFHPGGLAGLDDSWCLPFPLQCWSYPAVL